MYGVPYTNVWGTLQMRATDSWSVPLTASPVGFILVFAILLVLLQKVSRNQHNTTGDAARQASQGPDSSFPMLHLLRPMAQPPQGPGSQFHHASKKSSAFHRVEGRRPRCVEAEREPDGLPATAATVVLLPLSPRGAARQASSCQRFIGGGGGQQEGGQGPRPAAQEEEGPHGPPR
jgi:hypothetical protein